MTDGLLLHGAPPEAGLHALAGAALPAWCDALLAPPEGPEFFAGRAWYEATLAHALAPGQVPLLAVGGEGAVALPLLEEGGRLRALATDYTIEWRPLVARGLDDAALRAAGREIGAALRGRPPVRLEALPPEHPALGPLLAGMRRAGLVPLRHAHFGNWHDVLPGGGWDSYLAARPPALRTTIARKTTRCLREMRLEWLTAPGPALEAGIAAYEEVRARSWKPHEPFPAFDRALMRAAARLGLLRLAVLRRRSDDLPAAAQYWIVAGGRATVLKLAHDETMKAASPGTALTAMAIRGLIEEGSVRELDFGRGDDPYKALWVARRRPRIGVLLADPTTAAGLLAIARHAAGRARAALRRGKEEGAA